MVLPSAKFTAFTVGIITVGLLELDELVLEATLLELAIILELIAIEELTLLDVDALLLVFNGLELLLLVSGAPAQPLRMGSANAMYLKYFFVPFIMNRSRLLFILCSSSGRSIVDY